MSHKTTDLCDHFEAALGETLFVAAPLFRSFGARRRFGGEIVTLKLFEDNSLVRTALSENGKGKVLVVDGGGSLRCALVGDQLALLAAENEWAGIVVNGCIRDSADIAGIDVGLFALATHPQKSVKRNSGERDLPIHFANIRFVPGHWLYADEDGVVVSATALSMT